MNKIYSEIEKLRSKMKEESVDWYFATSDDFHGSEYVADYFKVREHYTGFTGENAFLMLGNKAAYMWTDGRFFIQAENQLKDTGVSLMKMGEPGVPSIPLFVKENVKENETLAFDGRMVSTSMGKRIESILSDNKAKLEFGYETAGNLWSQRPALPVHKVLILDEDITGESMTSKISKIREKISEAGASYHFLSSIDDIAWITNMRGSDVECNPVFLSYLFVSKDEIFLFMENDEISDEIKDYAKKNSITLCDYNEVIGFLRNFDYKGSVLLDEGSVNFSCYKTISSKADIVNKINPSRVLKAVKNDVEINRLKSAYVKDSVCVTKFIYWLKNAIGKEELTEISVADYLDNLRKNVDDFLDLSFPTISGYASNGAIVHYSATPESNATLKPEGMILVDSGGQYLSGTTDVTRTISLGKVSDKMRLHYTKVAIGMLSLANAKFLYGCTGRNLDILSRAPLWNMMLDYKHGTGHGIGYILNVHEGPQNIRWKFAEGMVEYPFEAGMVTSDEPGIYIEGEYGIRIENAILCVDVSENEYGKFLGFEHLTYVPLDRELLDVESMSQEEKNMVNAYNEMVYEKIKDELTASEAKWLRNVTLPL